MNILNKKKFEFLLLNEVLITQTKTNLINNFDFFKVHNFCQEHQPFLLLASSVKKLNYAIGCRHALLLSLLFSRYSIITNGIT